MRKIKLSKNLYALVDNEHYESLSQYKWHVTSGGYAGRTLWKSKPKYLFMHRLITNCPVGKQVDHINGNRLDNRKSNLRIVDEKFNHINVAKRRTNKSGHKGVDWRKDKKKWRARVQIDKRQYSLGHFTNLSDAVKAYEAASTKLFGEFKRPA